jgi:acyl-CoA synthetase (AMP-forming)/AMP-acid ligase II
MKWISGFELVKYDVENEVPLRDANGHCIPCDVNEVGELLGWIDQHDPVRQFAGYHGDQQSTDKKMATNVFVKDDVYFRTGDLLRHDAAGYWHFVDRIGDTFRWKGENVSTTEVAEVLSTFPGVIEINVYGVEVPHMDGRAPMAAIVADDESLDLDGLAKYAFANLPSYAVPLFLRKQPQVAITGTFKHQKVTLRKQGIDPTQVGDDSLFWLHPGDKTYMPYGSAEYTSLKNQTSSLGVGRSSKM